MENHVLFSCDERGVASLTLNRPDLRNAFDDAFIAALTKILKKISADPKVRVLQLRGAGKAFCAGGDLGWMQRMVNYSYEENLADADALAELMFTLNNLPCPTIAVVHGAAYGGGVGLAACCDLAIASREAQFCLSEVKLGIIPAIISPYVLSKIGEKAMRRFSLTAEVFDATAAKAMQLVDEVVSPEALEATAEKFTQMLLQNAPEAIAKMKALLQRIRFPQSFEKTREETVAAIAACRVSAGGQEGLKAFLEKRQPKWIN